MTDPTLRVLIPSEKIQAGSRNSANRFPAITPAAPPHDRHFERRRLLSGGPDATMKRDVYIDFMGIFELREREEQFGRSEGHQGPGHLLEGAEVLIVEDIVDSGITLNYLMHVLDQRKAAFHTDRGAARQARAPLAAGARELRGIPDSGPVRGGVRPGFRREVPQPGRCLRAGRTERGGDLGKA